MKEFTFKFYADGKCLSTKVFKTYTVQYAYKMADNVLRKSKIYDDWECITDPKLIYFYERTRTFCR